MCVSVCTLLIHIERIANINETTLTSQIELHMAHCFTLELSKEELNVISSVVDNSLNVQPALAEPDRDTAVKTLGGDQIMRDKKFPECVIKRKKIRLHSNEPKKQSNWPIPKEARERLKSRTAELRAQGVPSPFGRVSASGKEYLPSPRQKIVLAKLKAQVATLVGTGPDALSTPQAVVSMIPTGSTDRRLHTRDGMGVTISVRDNTKPLEIMIGGGPPVAPDLLEAGEAIAFDRRHGHREPEGDWRRTLFFSHGKEPTRT